MATYLKEEEIKVYLDRLMDKFAGECMTTCELNPDFTELMKHNFFAKYVHYDPSTEMVEVGINESKERSPGYPDIKVYHYALSETRQWLGKQFRSTPFDLEFYAKLISKNQDSDPDVILFARDDD